MKPIKLPRLISSILIPLGLGALSGFVSGSFKGFNGIVRPPLSPPSWFFPVVWSILYILMGISAYIITDKTYRNTQNAIRNYYIQLSLNLLWPIVFFGFDMYFAAIFVLIALIIAIIATFYEFSKINRIAAYLLIPYLIWCLFALYLNVGVAVLN